MKKTFKKIAAVAISVMMVVAMAAPVCSATESEGKFESGNMTFTTTLKVSKDTITAPAVEFAYTLAGGEAYAVDSLPEGLTVGNDKLPVICGNEYMPTEKNYTASFATTDLVTDGIVATNTDIDFSEIEYGNTGIYHYTLTANATDGNGYTVAVDSEKDVFVYVTYDDVKKDYVVSAITLFTGDPLEKTAGFTNAYGPLGNKDPEKPIPTDPEDPDTIVTPETIIIKAYAFGSTADSTQEFHYTLDTANLMVGTVYAVSGLGEAVEHVIVGADLELYSAEKAADGTYAKAENATAITTFALAEADTVVIKGATHNMEVTAKFDIDNTDNDSTYKYYSRQPDTENSSWNAEKDIVEIAAGVAERARTITVDLDNADDANTAGYAVSRGADNGEEDDTDIVYDDDIIPATGIIIEFAPYILLMLAAVALMVVHVNRRRAR